MNSVTSETLIRHDRLFIYHVRRVIFIGSRKAMLVLMFPLLPTTRLSKLSYGRIKFYISCREL